jgi:hypothetical protein
MKIVKIAAYLCEYYLIFVLSEIVVRVSGYTFRGPGSIPGANIFSEK